MTTASLSVAPAIEFKALSVSHGSHRVLENLNLSLQAGQWHVVLGRSGIGKSTLLHLMADLVQADQGDIVTSDGEALAPRVAIMLQDDALLPWLSVRENVALGARLRGRATRDDLDRADTLIERVGLADWRTQRPGALSGGMRQRVALARTLFEARPVVLMDEPFSRLDALTRAELYTLAIELLDSHTVVMVTHDPIEALRLADQVTVLHGGSPTATSRFAPPGSPPRQAEDPGFGQAYADLWALLDAPIGGVAA